MTETQLVAAAREGDRDAIRHLYDRYAPRVFAVVRRIAGNDDLAQDFAQEAWLRAIRALASFRGDARFSTWLHRIAVNAALEAARKADVRGKREGAVESATESDGPRGDPLLARRLDAALARLPAGMREVLVLHDVEEYTHEEIAETLGISAGTSKSQLFKARGKMREMMAGPRIGGTVIPEGSRSGLTSDGEEPTLERTKPRGLGRPDDRTYEGAEA